MHISEGILSAPVLIAGAGVAAAGLAVGLKSTEEKDIPKVALLSAAFFLASFIHVPVGPSSVHLILNGINGLLLGWAAFPSIFVALVLQAVLFHVGGLTTLGVNTVIMAAPAVMCRYIFFPFIIKRGRGVSTVAAFLCGGVSVLTGCFFIAASLIFTEESFLQTARVVVFAHIPVMIIEGIITAVCVGFLLKVKPEMLGQKTPGGMK